MSHFIYPSPFNLPLLESSSGSEAVTVRALIRNRDFGCLIGKDGSTHQRLERDFRVKVYFLEPDRRIHERLISIAGTAHNVAEAWCDVLLRMFKKSDLRYGEKLGVKVLVPDCLAKQMVKPFDQLDQDDNDRGGKEKGKEKQTRKEDATKEKQMNQSENYQEVFGQDDGFEPCKCELEEIIYESGASLELDDESLFGSTDRCLQVLIESLDNLDQFKAAIELIAECFIRYRYLAMSPMNTYYSSETNFQRRQRRPESGSWSLLSSPSPPPPASEDGQGGGSSMGPVSYSSSSPVQPTNLKLWRAFSQNASMNSDDSYFDSHNHHTTFDTPRRAFPIRNHNCYLKLLLANEEVGMLLANRGTSPFLAREIERQSMAAIDISPLPPLNRPIRGLLQCHVSHISPNANDWHRPSDIYRFPRVARVSATVPAALVDACMRIAISLHGILPFRQLRNGEVSLYIIIPNDNLTSIFSYGGHRVQALQASTGTLISQADEILPESEERVLRVVGVTERVEEVLRQLLAELEEVGEPSLSQSLREYDPLGTSQAAKRSSRGHGGEF